MRDRPHDIVLLGATGFTGALTAEYLVAHSPSGTRLALVGRDQAKLESLRDRLGTDAAVLRADVTDRESLDRVARSTRVLATTVGPYVRYGDPVVAACAEAGTDYLDLCGEPEFLDRTYVRHHARAQGAGARLVHSCGFDSIPADLGALFAVQQLPEDVPIRLRGYVTGSGALSGGTFQTAVSVFSRTREASAAHAERRRVEPSGDRRVRAFPGRPGYEPALREWVFPAPTVDPQIVASSARSLGRFGPDFSYSHYFAASNPAIAASVGVAVVGVSVMAQLPPARRLLLSLRPSGTGPSAARRARSWFRVRFIGDGGGRRVMTEVGGGDPGYEETAKMLAESALCLATDDLPVTSGQVTTAVAMGDTLRARLQRAGITFRVL